MVKPDIARSCVLRIALSVFAVVLTMGVATTAHGAEPRSLFDGKSFEGWEGDTTKTWRIENGAITGGSLEVTVPRNEFLCTKREFANFDLRLKYKLVGTEGFVNGGVQFRSKRIPNHHEVTGYQADIGMGYDGALYDESRRNRMLAQPSKEVLEKSLKKNEWNDYRIRCEGKRIEIWLNGTQTINYVEDDAAIPLTGLIGLQIHGGCKAVVQFKDILIEELPGSRVADANLIDKPVGRMTKQLKPAPKLEPFANERFSLKSDDVVVFTGSENMVIEQQSGWLEAALTQSFPEQQPRFRHMGYEGDTVYRQNRMMNWGSWLENLDAADASVVVAWFGQVEAFDATKTPTTFEKAYRELLDKFSQRTPRLVILSPPPFETPTDPRVPDNTPRNALLKQHAAVARRLASERKAIFVDVFELLSQRSPNAPKLTRDGMHFTPEGMREVAKLIALQLGAQESQNADSLRAAIVEKNRIWFDNWRCMNWAFAYGDRTTQPFAKPTQAAPPLVEELARFQPLMAHADATIRAVVTKSAAPELPIHNVPRANPEAATPEEQMSRFVIRDGFEVNLFADEKLDVIRPIQMRWDERGRLWVLCVPSYPQVEPGSKANDFLVMLEDTNGDGRADKSTRIAEHLMMPMGFELADGGIYVCESTQVVHLRDTNGDGKMDSRRVVLSGFGTGDSHQNVNSIRWGADGCLWFSQGYHIWSYVETPHGLAELNRSGIWRFNPRTLRLDSFLNESTAGLNCWGVTFDDHGQVFHASGADFVVWHTTPALVPTLHPLGLGAGLAGSRGKSMEPEFLSSSHLPDDLQGVLLKSTYFTSQVQLYRLHDEGAGFRSSDLGDLIASKGTEFRPLETRVGPDGAIYICDWLNPVIGHYQASYRDPRRDLSHGRIWRMTAKGRPLVTRPKLEDMSPAQLIEQLNSPERWIRDQAKYSLYRKPKAEVIAAADAAIKGLVESPDSSAVLRGKQHRLRYELSGVFSAHEEPRLNLIKDLQGSDDFRWRAWAAHLVGIWADKLEDPLTLLTRAALDDHPRVRMEAVVAASYVPHADAVKVATLVLDKPMDGPINYALTQCIHALEPRWKSALAQGKLDFGPRFHALAKLLTTVGDTSVVPRIRELLDSGKFSGGARDSLLAALIENGGPQDVEFAIGQAPDSQFVLDALTTVAFRKRDSGYGAVLQQLLESPYPGGRIAGCRMAATWSRDFGQLARISAIAANEKATSRERAAAILAISKIKGRDSLNDLLAFADSRDATIRAAALESLAPLDPVAVATRAAQLLKTVKESAEVAPLFLPLLNRKGGSTTLAQALTDSKPSSDAAKLALQWLGEIGRDDVALLNALNASAGITASRSEFSPQLVKQLLTEAQANGDAERGRVLFKSAQATCLKCHKLGDEGGKLGPDLTVIARAQTPEAITESFYWPKRAVKEGFLLTTVITADGLVLNGYKEKETDKELTLKLVSDGSSRLIIKADIEVRQDAGTIMPDGLTDWMTTQQRQDLLRFLIGLGK